ncbi:citrate synthase [Duganella sp. FT80W]|uniref:citrate synthase (unknown stereospecificity) n=1 Tax=Duganella guangzhouensis TaxID=2666084 RepID=A0A6I2LA24_9BURK|nr:citrate synthase family protein [Duganella guangzhouensis]MRW94572.1 citrate synthase [Duganella guangzhouensis]
MVWMTAAEALDVLNVRPQTLYANVSRGKIRARPDEVDPRRSLYHRDDVLRMARRANGRRKVEIVSSEAMQYGDPVLPSSISTIADGRLLYRGYDAALLAERASLEEIAVLLWQCEAAEVWPGARLAVREDGGDSKAGGNGAIGGGDVSDRGGALGRGGDGDGSGGAHGDGSALAAGLLALARRSAVDAASLGRSPAELRAEAAQVLVTLVGAMTGTPDGGGEAIHLRLAHAWHAEPHADLIRRALVLMADNELNASTFATRVAISTGASLAAGVLAGFTTLTGPLHGGAAKEFAQLVTQAQESSADEAVRAWLASGKPLPAFGHPLYSAGDPRAQALIKLLPKIQLYEALTASAAQHAGELPNCDYALSLLTTACGLPDDAPFMLFAIGRCVGWLAHALEQVQANRLIRPRARYTGPAPLNAGINAEIY